jgi:zinc-binding alcohol dehydrogenase family protein
VSQTVRAVAFTETLPVDDPGSLVDVDVPRPEVGPRDLLVEVHAVSVNPVDTKIRSGAIDLGHEPGEPSVLGFDASGVVLEVGAETSLFAPGDEVFYSGSLARPGSNAELHAVDERVVGPKPETLSHAEAAALPLTAITAWEGLFEKLRLTAESTGTLLVAGASGGVGSVVLQLAETLLPGVRTVATSSRPETDAWVTGLGADAVVNHRADDHLDQVRAAAPDGVDWVFTSVIETEGALELYVEVLNLFGEIVAIDDPETLDVVPLKSKSLSLHWEFMGSRPIAGGDEQASHHQVLTEVAALVDAGRLRSTLTTELSPIDAEQLREAHRLVESGRVIGKVVVSRG